MGRGFVVWLSDSLTPIISGSGSSAVTTGVSPSAAALLPPLEIVIVVELAAVMGPL